MLEYKNTINQLYQLKASKDNELINKDKEIDKLTSRIKVLQSSINKDIKEDLDKILMESAIVKKIIEITTVRRNLATDIVDHHS